VNVITVIMLTILTPSCQDASASRAPIPARFTAFCKNTGHGASGRKKICATTKNWPIGKIEYVATVDLINGYLIDRFNRISLEFAVYLVNSLHINYLCSQTVAIAIWAKYQPYGQTSAM